MALFCSIDLNNNGSAKATRTIDFLAPIIGAQPVYALVPFASPFIVEGNIISPRAGWLGCHFQRKKKKKLHTDPRLNFLVPEARTESRLLIRYQFPACLFVRLFSDCRVLHQSSLSLSLSVLSLYFAFRYLPICLVSFCGYGRVDKSIKMFRHPGGSQGLDYGGQ